MEEMMEFEAVEEEEEEEVEDDDGEVDNGENVEGEGGDDGDEEDECVFRFNSRLNPLDLTENNASGLQTYQEFERLKYEALAERKCKRKRKRKRESVAVSERRSEENVGGMSMEEFTETFNFGGFRRKSRKLNKKRGKGKGSRSKLSLEVKKMLGEATCHYAHGRYEQAISVLSEAVILDPNLPDLYHTLGLVHNALGNHKKACHFYVIAAFLLPKDSSLWKQLLIWSVEKGDTAQARFCLCEAIKADPTDIGLRFHLASLYVELGDYERAAESYEQIQKLCPDDIEALKTGA